MDLDGCGLTSGDNECLWSAPTLAFLGNGKITQLATENSLNWLPKTVLMSEALISGVNEFLWSVLTVASFGNVKITQLATENSLNWLSKTVLVFEALISGSTNACGALRPSPSLVTGRSLNWLPKTHSIGYRKLF